ncbi:hypothetical protein CLSAB_18900 [Clostridium saccharobutylicum]|uniref:hypothetical protein n=1 Tax=Clostridium saccharobutylicum TaxID=169679 RepID=UPI00098C4888|nr:hypothetical protein [Clostridium saccharobutylicum]OOM17170.1 hypothetical protein CLSAB_18900 [Clostridium saccharobutylicum]
MEDMELLECLINTEISKTKYQARIAKNKGQVLKYKALINKMAGLKDSLNLLYEVREMEG